MATMTVQQKVKNVIGRISGVPAKEISIKDKLRTLQLDEFDIDEMVEVLSDHYDIDLGIEYDSEKHTHVGHIVKLVEKLSTW